MYSDPFWLVCCWSPADLECEFGLFGQKRLGSRFQLEMKSNKIQLRISVENRWRNCVPPEMEVEGLHQLHSVRGSEGSQGERKVIRNGRERIFFCVLHSCRVDLKPEIRWKMESKKIYSVHDMINEMNASPT